MPPKRRRRFQGLYYHSSPPKVLPMNGQVSNSNGRRRQDPDDFSVKLSTIRIWMHEKDIGKLTRVLWAGQGTRLRQQASTNPKVKRFLAAVPYVMNSIKDVHQAVIDNNLETLQTHLEPPVPPALVTCRDANGLNLIHKAAGLGHATILEYLITTWPDGVHETDITGKTPLHWAASAKNNMRCYTLLTQAGCDEEAVDYKMKTPSYYRHKPNEIERAFLTYVPEAPRVSPDVSTDWEALSDDGGDGKKLDIKIPEMNGFGRHSNAESNENASEAEGASQEDEDMSKDGDQEPADDRLEEEEEPSAEENENEADDKEPEPEVEPDPEADHESEPEQEPELETTEATSEKEEEQTHESEEPEENEEHSKKDQTNETEDQNEKQLQHQTENLNENTENLTKDTHVDEIEKDGKSSEENIQENKEMGEEKSDKDNERDKDKQEDTEESKESVDHIEDIKKSSSTESSDKGTDSNKEEESKEADHMEQVTEDKDKEHEDKEKDQPTMEMEAKEMKEQEKEKEETNTEKERNEKEIKDSTNELSSAIESKNMKEQQHETNESQTTMNGDQDKLVDDKKSQEENMITKTEEEIKNEKEHDAEKGKDLEENKTKEQDKEQDAEVVKASEENKNNEEGNLKEDIKDDKDVGENANGIGTKVEKEEEENLKTVSEALENIKEEVKDNVKYLANQIQNLFTSDSDSETKEKDDKEQRERENDKDTKESAPQGDADSNQDETKDKMMENKTEDEKLKEKEIHNKNDETNVSSITKDSENKTDQTTECSTSKPNTNENEITTNQAQSTTESLEIKPNTETPKTPQQQQTLAEAIEKPQTAIVSDKPSSGKQISSTSDKPHSAKQTPSTSDKPHSARQKSPKKETEKTEEDENNNNNSKNNDNIALDKETTDKEYQELNQALEQYKKEEKEEKENEQEQDLSTDLGQKLEDMADSVKENVKEITDKVKNIFTSNDKATIDKQESEANDVIVNAVDASKVNGIKTNEKNMESSDDTGDEDEDPEKHTENIADNKQVNENNTEEPEAAATENETTKEQQQETETQQQETETKLETQTDGKPPVEEEKNEEEFVADENNEGEDSSPTPSLAIEGFVQGDAEDNTVQSQTAAFDHDDDKESRIQSIIASGDMEQLAQIVLNGDGQKLLNVEATEPEIQAFLRNVPNYMNKIRRVHEAARGGSLLNLQQALDRRKFAVAKDEISPNGATPLHVAVLFGHSDIVRYLSARFPETTTITDNDGRTPLHYAAVISDNGHFYNVLLQLGANPKLVDKFGHTPEDYLSKEELKEKLNYGQLLKNFNAEELEQQLLSDQGQIENHSIQENPIFKTEQGKYLADNLADPLIKALTQVAQKRPSDPLQYLTNYLQNYAATRNTNGRTITQAAIHTGSSQTNSTILANSKSSTPPVQQQQQQQQQQMARQTMRMNGHVRHDNSENMNDIDAMQRIEEYKDTDGDNDDDGNDSEAEISRKLEERDEHGQSMLHFACARSHRKGGLIHLIEESKADITYRDELYRTARDVALQANQLGNAKEIDRYLISLAIVGDIKPFEHFAINGYDHIIDVLDDNETPIIDVVASRGQNELAQYLRSIRPLEELREELHQMIRENKVERVKEIANGPNGRWLIKAKNYYGRTALHIAILKESIEIVEMFVKIAPEALKIGDNLERTPLHYGMGTNIFENISRILIQSGAKRTYKDLKGRQPSYYFMNKADILRLQEEEDENR